MERIVGISDAAEVLRVSISTPGARKLAGKLVAELEGTNLVDDAGALPDQLFAHPVQRLQVQLIGRLGGDEFHRRALCCFGDHLPSRPPI